MLNNRDTLLRVNRIRRIKELKIEFLSIIIKSLIQNKNLRLRERIFFKLYWETRCSKSFTVKNICLVTGNYRGIYKKLNLSRRSLNRICKNNSLYNFKINSW